MGLESVTHIDDLDASNPATGDLISQGDDHIKNIKTALLNDFGNISGAVTADQADLNRTDVTTEGTAEASKVLTSDSSGYTTGAEFISPKVQTGINDTNGNELLKVTATGSAVNELTLANAATGNNPTITASGGDANIGIALTAKGTGGIDLNPGTDGVTIGTGNGIDGVLDEDAMGSDSDTHLATQQSIKAYVDANGGVSVAILQYQEVSGTGNDAQSATTWNTIDINTEVSDADSIVTVGSSQFTPASGTYLIQANHELYDNGSASARLRLYNATGASAVASGVQGVLGSTHPSSHLSLTTVFTANGTDAYELQIYPTADLSAGGALSMGDVEIYSQITLTKIG